MEGDSEGEGLGDAEGLGEGLSEGDGLTEGDIDWLSKGDTEGDIDRLGEEPKDIRELIKGERFDDIKFEVDADCSSELDLSGEDRNVCEIRFIGSLDKGSFLTREVISILRFCKYACLF